MSEISNLVKELEDIKIEVENGMGVSQDAEYSLPEYEANSDARSMMNSSTDYYHNVLIKVEDLINKVSNNNLTKGVK